MLLENEWASLRIDLEHGARLASFRIGELELLVGADQDPLHWGCYPMAPWTGRLRNGRFSHLGQTFQLPLSLPPHAIHGTVFDRPWYREGPNRVATDLGDAWPFAGRVVQEFRLERDHLVLRLEVHALADPFPAELGWHPWFRRRLQSGSSARLSFSAGSMYACDSEQIPTGETVAVPDGPWDDCFVDLDRTPEIDWPGALRLRLTSTASHWVIYDQPLHALCVEPMTGPPNALNLAPEWVHPGRPRTAEFKLQWQRDAGETAG